MPIIVPGQGQGRRLGLSRNQHPPPLLKRIGNQEPHVSSKAAAFGNATAASKMSRAVKNREPESITALPLSSSEDEDPDDSEIDGTKSQRGDIRRTVFSSAQSPPQTSNGQGNARRRLKPSSQGMTTNHSQDDEHSGSAGSKRRADDPVAKSSSHLTDGYGFTASSLTKKKKRAINYTNKSSQPRSSQSKSSQKSAPRSSAPQPSTTNTFKRLEVSSSPESARSHPAGFIKPEIESPEKARSVRFIKPEIESPEKERPARFIEPLSADSSPCREQQKPVFRHHNLPSSDLEQNTRVKRPRKVKTKVRKDSSEPAQEEYSQKPAFKVFALDDDDYLNDSDEKVDSTVNNEFSDDEAGDISIDNPVAVTTRCPMCHEVVDGELLEKYSDHGRMNIRKQAAFCRLHKRHTALNSRSQKGYPKIDWETIGKRFEKHYDFLKELLEGAQQSYYRNVLREKVESGQNRTLLKTQDSLTPGYYGPRGLRAMTEHIMRELSSVVRKRAVVDPLVSARGYTGYVQIVLVPELAVRLIMEDMSATEEDARKIMHESIEVGELLYEDVGDVIAGLSDEDR